MQHIILVVVNEVFRSTNVLNDLFFVKNHILSNLFFKHKPYTPSS